MPTTLNQQISSSIQSFVSELTTLVRTAALDSVQAVLGGGSAPARRGPGRPKGSGIRRGPGRPKGSGATKPAESGRRVRRSSEDVEAVAAKFLAFVKSNDGKRLEEIARALKTDTADLKRPVQKLLAAKAVRTTGAKRGTKYHVAGKRAAKSKRAAKKVVRATKSRKAAKPAKTKRAKATTSAAKSANVSRAKADPASCHQEPR